MELLLFAAGCLGWHLLVLATGAWLWAAKPWRLARDYGEFRAWQENQQRAGQATTNGRRYRPEDDVFTEVRG